MRCDASNVVGIGITHCLEGGRAACARNRVALLREAERARGAMARTSRRTRHADQGRSATRKGAELSRGATPADEPRHHGASIPRLVAQLRTYAPMPHG